MPLNQHAFTSHDANAFASLHPYNLEGSQTAYFHLSFTLKSFTYNAEHGKGKTFCVTLLQAVLFNKNAGYFLYRFFIHHSCPPLFSLSFHVVLGLNPNTSFGGTSIR